MNWDQITIVNRRLLLCFALATIALVLSFYAELVWKIEPCTLCKFQRIPLFIAIPVSLFCLFQKNKLYALAFLRMTFLILGILASYHLMIQFGFISDPCSVPKGIKTLDDFKNILNTPISCSTIKWSLFGIPPSGYNLALALFFIAILSIKPVETKRHLHA